MADIRCSVAMTVSRTNGSGVQNETRDFEATMAGNEIHQGVVSWGTTGAALAVLPVNTASAFRLRIHNLDATNYVELSLDGGTNYKLRVPKGEIYLLYIVGGTSVYVKANTAACLVEQTAVAI